MPLGLLCGFKNLGLNPPTMDDMVEEVWPWMLHTWFGMTPVGIGLKAYFPNKTKHSESLVGFFLILFIYLLFLFLAFILFLIIQEGAYGIVIKKRQTHPSVYWRTFQPLRVWPAQIQVGFGIYYGQTSCISAMLNPFWLVFLPETL
jgi:hypothetical protein